MSLVAGQFDIDHISFAVNDALSWASRLRRGLGAVPIAGETLPEFRYLLLYLGTADEGGRLELLEPAGPGFLDRFLTEHGEGPHHLTFSVPDLRDAVRQVRGLGLTVVGENYDHPSWREAFIRPDALHRTVIQLAQSEQAYPDPPELIATQERDVSSFPSTQGATEPLWWTPVWETSAGSPARLGATHLVSTDTGASRRLFADVLGAQVSGDDRAPEFTWPSGSLRVLSGTAAGITAIDLHGGPFDGLEIGLSRLARIL